MIKKDVPQDSGITEGVRVITYAVNEQGGYELTKSLGWEVVNAANQQAWDEQERTVYKARLQVESGRASCLYYYLTVNRMDIALLAQYSGLPRWRIKRHLKPSVFKKIKPSIVQKYATIFKVKVDDLQKGIMRPIDRPR